MIIFYTQKSVTIIQMCYSDLGMILNVGSIQLCINMLLNIDNEFNVMTVHAMISADPSA